MESIIYDEKRSDFLKAQGLTILRFWNNEVFDELEAVLEVIHRELTK